VVEDAVVLGGRGGYSLRPNLALVGEIPVGSPVVRDIHTKFTLHGFERPRAPFAIGWGDLSAVPHDTTVNSLPIKFPGSDYRVPCELAGIEAILRLCVSFEADANPHVDEYYAYVSLQRTHVPAGESQRSATVHSDGIQGRRIKPKVVIEHAYAVVDRDPTIFFPQGFDMAGVDVGEHLMDAVFEAQVDRRRVITFSAGVIVLFDAYCVHHAPLASTPGSRAFCRLTYSCRQYDRLGNTVNTLFRREYAETGWEFQPRPVPPDLKPPPTTGSRLILR
jgi:hypothetical protein